MNSRMSLIDLNVNLIIMQYGEPQNLEELHELLLMEFPEDRITFEEVCEWNSLALEVSDLEADFDYDYVEAVNY